MPAFYNYQEDEIWDRKETSPSQTCSAPETINYSCVYVRALSLWPCFPTVPLQNTRPVCCPWAPLPAHWKIPNPLQTESNMKRKHVSYLTCNRIILEWLIDAVMTNLDKCQIIPTFLCSSANDISITHCAVTINHALCPCWNTVTTLQSKWWV